MTEYTNHLPGRLNGWVDALRLDYGGVLLGLVFLALSLTPSLLPRPQVAQGVISGLSFAVGYGVGVLLWYILRRVISWRNPALARWGWPVLGIVIVTGAVILAPFVVAWQNGIRTMVGLPTITGYSWFLLLIVAFGVAVLAIAIGRGLRLAYQAAERRSGPLVRRVAGAEAREHERGVDVATDATSLAVVVLIMAALLWGTVASGLQFLDRGWSESNAHPDPNLAAPTSSLRSGGPGSLVDWDDLGFAGSEIVASGPDAHAIEALTNQSAKEPIRVYVGLESAPTYAERAAIAVNELQRTGATDRSVLVVAATTGTGWLDPQAIDAVEYLHGGDTALVALQYDDKPSWRSRIFNPVPPAEGASAQFYSVYAWWSGLPADHRPALVVYGLSLGSYAMQSAFPDLETLLARSDGAVFAGTPARTGLWEGLTARRDPSSPVTLPTLDDGSQVRWFSNPADFTNAAGEWDAPRVAYLQHGNDPVVWLSGSIFWQRPEWLEDGQRSPVVSPDMHWIPVVTGLQAVIDFTMGTAVPDDSGHKYGSLTLEAWIAVTGNGGLNAQSLDAIRATIASYDTLPQVDQ
ncbi:alpha/beta hydrolase [Demequina oxidasica]|uniref:alpha/beta hydrolase n=1 Tax=Demequina oxidasica TaxID=676199 RepID=UPI000782FDD1|nr:alpha/beta-hydrolase family protein [Demequina oxidasica]